MGHPPFSSVVGLPENYTHMIIPNRYGWNHYMGIKIQKGSFLASRACDPTQLCLARKEGTGIAGSPKALPFRRCHKLKGIPHNGGKSRNLQAADAALKDLLRVALKDLLRVALKDWLCVAGTRGEGRKGRRVDGVAAEYPRSLQAPIS
jgi:hypothetical protein